MNHFHDLEQAPVERKYMVDQKVRAHFGLLIHAKLIQTDKDSENEEPSLGHHDFFSCEDDEDEEMD